MGRGPDAPAVNKFPAAGRPNRGMSDGSCDGPPVCVVEVLRGARNWIDSAAPFATAGKVVDAANRTAATLLEDPPGVEEDVFNIGIGRGFDRL